MALQELFVELALDLKEYKDGLGDADKEAVGFAKRIRDRFDGAFSAVKTLAKGAALGIAGALAGGIVAIGATTFDASAQTRQAANDIQAQFGQTAEEAQRTAQLSRDVWAQNWGESIGDVSQAMGIVIQQLGEVGVTSDENVTAATADALALRDAFGIEVPESIDAARALMERFGLSSDQAFDFIASGMQSGLNANDDFMDSIREYAPVFESAGFSAEQMYSIMESGAASGVLGTDKIADAVKEMGIILNEGGDRASDAFESIGLDFEEISKFIAGGDEDWADYFDDIVAGINSIEDPMERQKAQVAIFGTMAEDLGDQFTFGLSSATTALEDMAGATDNINAKYANWGSLWEGTKRQVIDAIAPISDRLLEWASSIMPKVQEGLAGIIEWITKLVNWLGIVSGDSLLEFFSVSEEGETRLQGLFKMLGMGAEQAQNLGAAVSNFVKLIITAPDEGGPLLDYLQELPPSIQPISKFLAEVVVKVSEFISWIAPLIQNFVSWKDILIIVGGVIAATVIPAIISLIATLAPILLVVAAVVGGVALLRNAWEQNWGGIQEKTAAVIAFIQGLIQTGLAFITEFWNQNGATILATVQQVWGTIQTAIATVVTWIQTNVPAMVGGVLEWWNSNWPQIQATIETVWGLIQGVIRSAVAVIEPAIRALVDNAKNAMGNLSNLVGPLQNLWARIGPFVQAAATVIGGILVGLVGVIVGVVNGISNAIEPLINTFINVAENIILIVTGIIEFFTGFFNLLIGLFTGNSELIQQAWEQMGQGITDIVTGIYNGLVELFEGLLDTLIALVEGIVTGIIDFFTNLYDELVGNSIVPDLINDIVAWFEDLITWIGDVLLNLWATVSEPFIEMWGNLTAWFGEKATEIAQIGRDIIAGLVKGLQENGQDIIDTIMSFVTDAWDAVKNFFGIDSPSRLMHWAGEMLGQGLIDGIRSKITDAAEAMKALFDAMSDISGLGSGFAGVFQSRTLDPLQEQIDAVGGRIESVNQSIADTAAQLSSFLPSNFMQLGAGQRQLLLEQLAGTGFLPENDAQAQARVLLDLMRERNQLTGEQNRLTEEYEEAQQRILELQEAQANLNFLQQQMDLLNLITDNDLGDDLLEGLREAINDPGALVDVMTAALERMMQAAEDTLGIHSPSTWARDAMHNVMSTLAMTARKEANGLKESLSRALSVGLEPALAVALPGLGSTSTDNSNHSTTYGGRHIHLHGGGRGGSLEDFWEQDL